MPSSYTLGKNYTVSGLAGATDLVVTQAAERVDVTTRKGDKPIKASDAGLIDETFECTVLAEAATKFVIGKAYPVTLNGSVLADLVCLQANRDETRTGVITFKLKMRRGLESAATNQFDVGPGGYR